MDRIFTFTLIEQNASTSTVRLASSLELTRLLALRQGITCLWGLYDGANQACLEMLRKIGTADRIPEFIKRVRTKTIRLG